MYFLLNSQFEELIVQYTGNIFNRIFMKKTKQYQEPLTEVVAINLEGPLLTFSGDSVEEFTEIGGSWDAPAFLF